MKKIKIYTFLRLLPKVSIILISKMFAYFDNVPDMESFVIYSEKRHDTNLEKFSKDFSDKVRLTEI